MAQREPECRSASFDEDRREDPGEAWAKKAKVETLCFWRDSNSGAHGDDQVEEDGVDMR